MPPYCEVIGARVETGDERIDARAKRLQVGEE
jgi:hypothetical protein